MAKVYTLIETIICPYCNGVERIWVHRAGQSERLERTHRCTQCHHVIWAESWQPMPWWGLALLEGIPL